MKVSTKRMYKVEPMNDYQSSSNSGHGPNHTDNDRNSYEFIQVDESKNGYGMIVSPTKPLYLNPATSVASPKNPSTNTEKIEKSPSSENIVKSPMVGVAYLSVDPSTPPYVKVGQHVKQGETLLLIEAMKTFNEVKAPKSGIVKKIIVLNNQPVEFGDDLLIFE